MEIFEPEKLNELNHVTQAHQENQMYQEMFTDVNCVSQLNQENQVKQVIQETCNIKQVNQEYQLNADEPRETR